MISPYETLRFPLIPRLLEVRKTRRVSPRLVRLTLGGEALAGFQTPSPEDHVKLIVPTNGSAPAMPESGTEGLVFPPGQPRPQMRDYTPRWFDARAGELQIDIVLHGDGLVANWARRAQAGIRWACWGRAAPTSCGGPSTGFS